MKTTLAFILILLSLNSFGRSLYLECDLAEDIPMNSNINMVIHDYTVNDGHKHSIELEGTTPDESFKVDGKCQIKAAQYNELAFECKMSDHTTFKVNYIGSTRELYAHMGPIPMKYHCSYDVK